MSLHLFRVFVCVCLFVFASTSQIQAYDFSTTPPTVWPNGNVSMILKLGSAGRSLSDGNTSWDSVAQQALGAWNAYLGTIQFVSSIQSPGAGSNGDGVNQVFFSSTVYGQSFGSGVLAVTMGWSSGTRRTQADVIFNTAWSWDSYRGSLRPSQRDFRRVAIHEFGHVLGLDHPDQAGQNVTATMNSIVSNLDGLASDDINGARVLYSSSSGTSPPTILSQPQSRTENAGATVVFSVAAYGTQPMNYQWRRNGVAITGATGTNYWIPNVQPSDAGNYTVVVGNAAGTVTSATAVLSVNFPPSIAVQPQDRMVTVGSSAIITVSVTGSSPLSFQWYFNGTPISGATASGYFLATTQPANAGAYKVRVSNSLGSVESSIAVLTIQNPAVNQAGNLLVNGGFELPGGDGFFLPNGSTGVPGWVSVDNVSAVGVADNHYVRTPYYGHAASEGGRFVHINYHSHASATLNGIYQDFATLPGNTYQVTFDAATEISYGNPGLLAVSAGDTVAHYEIPNANAFPLPPSLPYNFSGWHNGSFTFTATGTVTRLQFFDEGVALGPYPLSQSQIGLAADGEYFYTIARNDPRIRKFDRTGKYLGDVGSLRDSLGLNAAQTGLSKDGQSFLTIAAGDYRIRRFDLTGSFITDVTGFNHAGVPDGNSTGVAVLPVPGGQTRLFSITQGDATVREWDGYTGAFWSNTVILTDINGPVSIHSDIDFDGQYFYAIAPNGPFIWKFDSTGRFLDYILLSEGADNNPATGNASPLLDNVRVSLVSTSLVVDVAPTNRIALVGDNVVIEPQLLGAGPFSCQWWFKGKKLAGQTNASLSLPNIQLRSRGAYQVEVRNNVSVVHSDLVSVSVVIPPTIVLQPRSITVREGKRATFRVTAKGSKPFAYQWFKGGIAIGQATNKVLTFLHAAPADAGSYSVRVSNAGAFQDSTPASLVVAP